MHFNLFLRHWSLLCICIFLFFTAIQFLIFNVILLFLHLLSQPHQDLGPFYARFLLRCLFCFPHCLSNFCSWGNLYTSGRYSKWAQHLLIFSAHRNCLAVLVFSKQTQRKKKGKRHTDSLIGTATAQRTVAIWSYRGNKSTEQNTWVNGEKSSFADSGWQRTPK